MIIWRPDLLPEDQQEPFKIWFYLQIQTAKAEERETCSKLAEDEEQRFDRDREHEMAHGAEKVVQRLRERK